MKGSLPVRALILIAAAKTSLAVIALPWAYSLSNTETFQRDFPFSVNVAVVCFFGLGAGLFVLGGRFDQRAVYLGGFFLCLAALYADRVLDRLIGLGEGISSIIAVILWLPFGAFLPYFLWLFVRHFPHTVSYSSLDRYVDIGIRLSAFAGLALVFLNLPSLFGSQVSEGSRALAAHFAPHLKGSLHSYIIVGVMILALPFAVWKSMKADPREKRRVRLMIAALILGAGPIMIIIMLQMAFRRFDAWVYVPENRQALSWAVFPPMFSIPFTTAYAVLVHRVIEVKLIARKAAQYALARYSAVGLAAVPVLCLGIYLNGNRQQTIAEIFSGGSALLLTMLATLGTVLFVRRQKLLDAIDRRFFREQYDARRILMPLVERIRNTADRRELADLVCHGIDRALHLETIALLVEEPDRGELADPTGRVRPRSLTCPLVDLLSSNRQPLDVDLEKRPKALDGLSERDREWLLDGDFKLLVPVVSFDGAMVGIIALGEKRSSLPFMREDLELLAAIANSAALALEVQRLRTARGLDPGGGKGYESALPTAAPAQECFGCGRLYLPQNSRCTACDRDLERALVPYVLPGRFRFERRIGAGGMGVVYRAVDLALSRSVAVKTMRRVSVDDALRLRREARAAAAVHHPNLALIYGFESWQGTPMLIMEFLEGGTLEDRLEKEVLGPRETLDLGLALTGALEKLHMANILHRDLKPSNIGYGVDGAPRLMDFGIARLQFDLRREVALVTDGPTSMPGLDPGTWGGLATPTTSSKQMVGTLHYLAPEAINGEAPTPGFDLWGLTVVLLECLVGERAFNGTRKEILAKISAGEIPDLKILRPDCPPYLGDFFAAALHKEANQRPISATGFRQVLQDLRQRL